MTKRLMVFALIAAMCLSCAGCANLPRIDIATTAWSSDNITVRVGEGYELIANHPYDIIETEQGVDVVVHFKEK